MSSKLSPLHIFHNCEDFSLSLKKYQATQRAKVQTFNGFLNTLNCISGNVKIWLRKPSNFTFLQFFDRSKCFSQKLEGSFDLYRAKETFSDNPGHNILELYNIFYS